jgi:S1-C subfamily serine protease
VVEGAARVTARLRDGRELNARVVATDPDSDLAVLKVQGGNLTVAPLGDSRQVRPGDGVVAIGNPLGFEHSVSQGVVSAYRKGPFRVDGHTLGDMIQTDASINQGNSGGGLFDAAGQLIGINTAIMSPRGGSGSIGIAFAIPSQRMSAVAEALIEEGRMPRPWLGIRYRIPRTETLARRQRNGKGVRVEDVIAASPASTAGVRPDDVLRRLGDCPIHSADDIYRFVDRYQPGQKVTARVLRGGEEKVLTLVLGEKPR